MSDAPSPTASLTPTTIPTNALGPTAITAAVVEELAANRQQPVYAAPLATAWKDERLSQAERALVGLVELSMKADEDLAKKRRAIESDKRLSDQGRQEKIVELEAESSATRTADAATARAAFEKLHSEARALAASSLASRVKPATEMSQEERHLAFVRWAAVVPRDAKVFGRACGQMLDSPIADLILEAANHHLLADRRTAAVDAYEELKVRVRIARRERAQQVLMSDNIARLVAARIVELDALKRRFDNATMLLARDPGYALSLKAQLEAQRKARAS